MHRRAVVVLLLVLAIPASAQSLDVLMTRGATAEREGRYKDAAALFRQARALAEKQGDRAATIEAQVSLGHVLYARGEMNEAFVSLQRAYDLAVAIQDAKRQRMALEAIANMYADEKVGQYDRAIEYYLQLLPQYERAGERPGVADTLYNIGATYERKSDLATAESWFRRALATERQLGRTDQVAYVQRSIGVVLGKQGRTDEALTMLNEALATLQSIRDVEGTAMVRQSRGIVHRRAGNTNEAIADLEATRAYYARQDNPRYLEKTEDELALAYAAANRWREAYEARTRHAALQRELAERLREEHTSRLRVQFDAEKKEQENRSLLRDNETAQRIRRLQTTTLILGALIIAALAYFMFRLRTIAMTDELTRLPNRRQFMTVTESALAHAIATREPFSLIAFDVDFFKRVNDTWGHAAGDRVLQRVGDAASRAVGNEGTIGRTGGEEFMIVLPATNAAGAVAVAERVRNAVVEIDCHDIDPSLELTISLGVAQWEGEDALQHLAARVDEMLYRAKDGGRNRVVAAAVA